MLFLKDLKHSYVDNNYGYIEALKPSWKVSKHLIDTYINVF